MINTKQGLHPRNLHRSPYDFKKLIERCPVLTQFVVKNAYGNDSIDYTNPLAVKILNKALLLFFYNIEWDLPSDYLCPPIPGRADYIHYVADLLSVFNKGMIPQGKSVRVLDIGVGANGIYPLIGHSTYRWSFVATDINSTSLSIAKRLVQQNNLDEVIEFRLQTIPQNIFKGVVENTEVFDISICNPPFHTSAREANAGTIRKNKNLKIKTHSLNFGGKSNELWCPGGEVAFITQMIKESVGVRCKWFTTLVSKISHLSSIYRELKAVKPAQVRTLEMNQGQKKSRIVAWTFCNESRHNLKSSHGINY